MPLVILNKPFQVMSQFRDEDRSTLADYVTLKDIYPAGRLDFDSEGLILLTDDGRLQARISQPKAKISKTYWAQVEGMAAGSQLEELVHGVRLKDGPAKATQAKLVLPAERLWERNPPIRYRKSVPDCWIEMSITEGRNRQIRRMTAAVGLPTLRLIRVAVGPWQLDGLKPGQSRQISNEKAWHQLGTR